jgi:hypothetical protein
MSKINIYLNYLILKAGKQATIQILNSLKNETESILLVYLEKVLINKVYLKINFKIFFTLNIDDKILNLPSIILNIKNFIKYLKKKKINYLYVCELGEKKNYKHIHFVIDKFISINELVENWKCGSVDDIKNCYDIFGLLVYFCKNFTLLKIPALKVAFLGLNVFGMSYDENEELEKLNESEKKLIKEELFLENFSNGYVKNNEQSSEYEKSLKNSAYGFIYKTAVLLVKKYKKEFNSIINELKTASKKKKTELKEFIMNIEYENYDKIHFYLIFLLLRLGSKTIVNKYDLINKISLSLIDLLDLKKKYKKISINLDNLNNKTLIEIQNQDNLNLEYIIGYHFLILIRELYYEYIEFRDLDEIELLIDIENISENIIRKTNYQVIYKEKLLKLFNNYEQFLLEYGSIDYRNLMVIKPVEWSDNNQGGYIQNKYNLYNFNPFNKIIVSTLYYKVINQLQNQAVIINYDYLEFINNNREIFFEITEKNIEKNIEKFKQLKTELRGYRNEMNIIVKRLCKDLKLNFNKISRSKYGKLLLLENIEVNLNLIKKSKKLKKQKDEILGFASDYFKYNRMFNPLNTLYKKYKYVYFPYNFDFRGRIYPYNTEINHMNGNLYRSLFLSFEYEILDVSILKIYIVRCYFKDKLLNHEELIRFEQIESLVINFRNLEIFKKNVENKFGLLASCLEYEKYLKFVNENPKLFLKENNQIDMLNNYSYKSNFLISVDAHCSGSQILGLLLRDYSALKALNLLTVNKTEKLNDFYIYVIGLYLDFLSKKELDTNFSEACKSYLIYKNDIFNLDDVNQKTLLRKLLKHSIMTFAYGLSKAIYFKRIQDLFLELYSVKFKKNIDFVFEQLIDFFNKFYDFYHNEVKIGTFYTYLEKYAHEFNKLNKEINFKTLIGGEISQKYVKQKVKNIDLRTKIFKNLEDQLNKLKSSNLNKLKKVPNKLNLAFYDYDLIDKNSQVRGFCANFVHSMDSSLLLSVLSELGEVNIHCLPIHDCFLIHPKNFNYLVYKYNKKLVDLFLKEEDYLNSFLDELDIQLNLDNSEIKKNILKLRSTFTENELQILKDLINQSQYSLFISG